MADTIDPKFLDKRTSARYQTSGQLDEKALERHLKALPDLQEKSSPVDTLMADEEDFLADQEDDLDDEADDADASPA